jgi:hypothetical protein
MLTLLLGGNASGDFKLKALLVYHVRTLGLSKARLRLYWLSLGDQILKLGCQFKGSNASLSSRLTCPNYFSRS